MEAADTRRARKKLAANAVTLSPSHRLLLPLTTHHTLSLILFRSSLSPIRSTLRKMSTQPARISLDVEITSGQSSIMALHVAPSRSTLSLDSLFRLYLPVLLHWVPPDSVCHRSGQGRAAPVGLLPPLRTFSVGPYDPRVASVASQARQVRGEVRQGAGQDHGGADGRVSPCEAERGAGRATRAREADYNRTVTQAWTWRRHQL